jgi:sugar lactone lactonase YvrE
MKNSNFIIAAFVAILFNAFQIAAQDVAKISDTKYTDLPDLFSKVTQQPVEAQIVAEFPKGTFLENIVVNSKGEYYVTSLFDGKIYRFSTEGTFSEFAQIPGVVSGITLDKNDNVVAVGAVGGKVPSVFHINKNGTIESTTTIEGGWLLNGVTRLKGDKFLIADSYTDRIFEFDLATKAYSVWLADESISRREKTGSIPGVNGLEVFGDTLFVTNMDKAQVVKVPLLKNGKAGTPKVWQTGLFADDFSIDRKGNLYITTHAYNSVVKLTPNGQRSIVATAAEGATGATSLAFARGKGGKHTAIVVTNGGVLIPPAEGLQTAKVVRLDLNTLQNSGVSQHAGAKTNANGSKK